MAIKSFALVTVLLVVSPLPAAAQQYGINTYTSGPVWQPRPMGTATGASDKHGQTQQPLNTYRIPTPQFVPGWKLPVPRTHHRH